MRKLSVLHCFHEYLNPTENWCFKLISSMSDVHAIITTRKFLKCDFYSTLFSYIKFPVNPPDLKNDRPSAFIRLANKFLAFAQKLYPVFVVYFARRMKPDLMHAHFSFIGWEYRNVARRLKVPLIISFYGFDYEWLPVNRPEWKLRYQELFKEATSFICEGHHGATVLLKYGCPEEKINIFKLGVNVETIPFYSRVKRFNELRLVQVASLAHKKGHYYTIKAFLDALVSCPNMLLTLVGRDNDITQKELHEMVKGSPGESKISFIDYISVDRLYEFMKEYHIFIHPSCYSEERDCEGGAPVVLLDAQATGMPVIATTHCDIPEEVIHNKTGILTEEKDITALSFAIQQFYSMDQEHYAAFSKRARKHIEDNYSITTNARKISQFYAQLCAERDLTFQRAG